MKKVKSFLFAMIPFLVLALTGCESVEENSGSFWSEEEGNTAVAEQTQTPESQPTAPAEETPDTDAPATGGGGEAGDNTFLWKPVADNDGRLVVLLPANLTASTVTVKGESPTSYTGRGNGNRQHFRFGKAGSAYGQNVSVIAYAGGSVLRQWTVPNGGSRWTSN
jgi:hypothetical protein